MLRLKQLACVNLDSRLYSDPHRVWKHPQCFGSYTLVNILNDGPALLESIEHLSRDSGMYQKESHNDSCYDPSSLLRSNCLVKEQIVIQLFSLTDIRVL